MKSSKKKSSARDTDSVCTPSCRNDSSRGFTLVEIAVVAMIIGILAGIAIPQFSKIVSSARQEQVQSDLEMLSSVILQLAWDTGEWPNGDGRTTPSWKEIPYYANPPTSLRHDNFGLMGNNGTLIDTNKWQGPYIGELPVDPWGNEYIFDPDYYIRDGFPNAAAKGWVSSKDWGPVIHSCGPNGRGCNVYDSDNVYIKLLDPEIIP